MNPFQKFAAISIAALSFASFDAAAAAIDNAASVVLLRTSCNDGAGGTLNNCFTTMSAMKSWIVNTRNPKPSASAPLIVEIGPGTFDRFALTCTTALPGYITVRGSGSDQTKIISTTGSNSPLDLIDCTAMAFQDVTIGPTSGVGVLNGGTIDWKGAGTSTWRNVVVITDDIYGWQENPSNSTLFSSGSRGSHFWFSSRFLAIGGGLSRPYVAGGSENRFFGSEITIAADPGSYGEAWALRANGSNSEINFYGGAIRIIAPVGANATTFDPVGVDGGIAAAVALDESEIHIHGTGIDVISADGDPIYALITTDNATIHADVSAYNLSTGSGGSVTRLLSSGGHIHAPYTWQHIPDPATVPNFSSLNGADMTTYTQPGGQPRVVVYSATCVTTTTSATPWWDSVDGVCR